MILQKSIEVEVTNSCNLRCVHCYLSRDRTIIFMKNLELYRKMLEDFADNGFINLTVTGGEPFLNPDIFEFLKTGRELKYVLNLKTNGTLIDEESAQKLAELKLKTVDVSIYSAIPEEHDSITGMKGSFEKSVKALKLLKKAGVRVAVVTVVIYKLEGWKGVYDLSRELGVDFTMAPGVFASLDNRSEVEDLKNSIDDFIDFYKYCDLIGKKQPLPYYSDSVFAGCGGGKDSIYVDSSFNIRPCPAYPEITGRYKEGEAKDIIEISTDKMNDRFKKMECHTCELVRYCSPCPARLKEINGNLACDCNSKAFAFAKKKIYDENA